MKGTFPQYTNMISTPNLFNASLKISRNEGANLDAKNRYLRIQCMKCEGYGHIQAERANTWSDDESEACNEGEGICNESLALITFSTIEQCSNDLTIFASGPLVDPSTYELPTSMIALSPSNVETTNVESGDDEEISDEEMTHSHKIMYEKLVEIVYENRGLLKQISQLSREKNELIELLNSLKSGMEDTQNELD